jgi:hypothetical protein
VLAEAVMQKEFRGVADPDQAWILGELIRYLEHSRSGAMEFDDMGESWTAVRDAVAAGTLRPADKGIATVVSRFDALLRFASLRLGRQLGTEVVPVLTRKELAEPALRAQALTQMLCQTGQLAGAIRIPDTVGQLVITADLRAGKVTCHVDLDAPREGRPTTRVNWLVRQLKNAPDPTREIRTFRVAAACGLGTKRGRGRGCFIDPAMAAAAHEAEPTKPTSLGSTDYSSRTAPLTPRLLTLPPPSRRTRPEPPNRSSRMRHMRAPPTVRAPSGIHEGSGQLTSWLRSHSS